MDFFFTVVSPFFFPVPFFFPFFPFFFFATDPSSASLAFLSSASSCLRIISFALSAKVIILNKINFS